MLLTLVLAVTLFLPEAKPPRQCCVYFNTRTFSCVFVNFACCQYSYTCVEAILTSPPRQFFFSKIWNRLWKTTKEAANILSIINREKTMHSASSNFSNVLRGAPFILRLSFTDRRGIAMRNSRRPNANMHREWRGRLSNRFCTLKFRKAHVKRAVQNIGTDVRLVFLAFRSERLLRWAGLLRTTHSSGCNELLWLDMVGTR